LGFGRKGAAEAPAGEQATGRPEKPPYDPAQAKKGKVFENKNVFELQVDGKTVGIAKLDAHPGETALAKKAGAVEMPRGSENVHIPKVIGEGRAALPAGEGFEPVRGKEAVVFEQAKGKSLGDYLEGKAKWEGEPITPQEWNALKRGVKELNKNGVEHMDLKNPDNILVWRDGAGKIQFEIIDWGGQGNMNKMADTPALNRLEGQLSSSGMLREPTFMEKVKDFFGSRPNLAPEGGPRPELPGRGELPGNGAPLAEPMKPLSDAAEAGKSDLASRRSKGEPDAWERERRLATLDEASKLSQETGKRVEPQKMHDALERYYADQGVNLRDVVPKSELAKTLESAAKDPKFREYLADPEAASAKYKPVAPEHDFSLGTEHGSGGGSREEHKLGQMLSYNKATGQFEATSSRATPTKDNMIMRVRPDGTVEHLGGGSEGKKIPLDVLEQKARDFAAKIEAGKGAVEKQTPVHDLSKEFAEGEADASNPRKLKPRESKGDLGDTSVRDKNLDLLRDAAKERQGGRALDVAPDGYRERLAQSGTPEVVLEKVLTHKGSTGPVFDAKLNGEEVVVKSFTEPDPAEMRRDPKEAWDRRMQYFDNEVAMGKKLNEIIPDMTPKVFGEVDTGGNPSWAMEKIKGKDLDSLTPREASQLLTPETAKKVADGIERLRKAGLGGADSPQIMILTEPQTINGVPHKAGDPIFMDPGGVSSGRQDIWRSPAEFAHDVMRTKAFGDALLGHAPDVPIEKIPLTPDWHAYADRTADAAVKAALAEPAPTAVPAAAAPDATGGLKPRQSKGSVGEIEPPSAAELERYQQKQAEFKKGGAGVWTPRDFEVSKFMTDNPGYKPGPTASEFQRFQDLSRRMAEGGSPRMLPRDFEVMKYMADHPEFRPAPEPTPPVQHPSLAQRARAEIASVLPEAVSRSLGLETAPVEKPGPNGEPTRAEVEHYQHLENLRRQGQSPAMFGRDFDVANYMAAHPDYQPGRVEMRTPAQGLPATPPTGEFLKGRASEPIQSNHVTIEAGGKRLEVLTPDQYYGRYPKDAVRLGPTVERVIVDPSNPTAIKGLRAGEEFTLGRGAPVDGKPGVFMDQAGRFELPASVSGQHLKITNTHEGLRVTDLGSTNGTRIETPHRAAALGPEIEAVASRAPPAVEALDMRSGHVEDFSTSHPVDIDVAGRKFRVMDVEQFNAAHPEAAIADGQGIKKVLFDPENPRSLKALREGESFEFGRGNPKANERFGLDNKVSGKQFNITETPEGVRIEQVGKSNPTRVEGVRAEGGRATPDISEAKTDPHIRLPEKAQAHGGVDPAATDADLAKHVAGTDGDAAFVRTTAKKEAGRPNEDHVHIDAGKKILIVADGMGGHGHGDIASGIAKRVIAEEVASRIGPNTTPAEAGQILRDALTKANKAILDDVKAHPEHHGMGTTASVGVVVVDPVTGRNVLVTANVGDSAVLVRRSGGELDHVSHEDSSIVSAHQDYLYKQLGEGGIDVAKLEKTGKLSPAELKKIMADPKLKSALEGSMSMSKGGSEMLQAALQRGTPLDVRSAFETHGQRNVIGNALGVKPDLMITPETVRTTEVRKGDVALAVSDGVLDNLGHDRMNSISKDAKSPAELMDKLAAESHRIATNPADAHEARYKKPDDISGVALRIGEPPAGGGERSGLKPRQSKGTVDLPPTEPPPTLVDRAKAELASVLPERVSRSLGLEPPPHPLPALPENIKVQGPLDGSGGRGVLSVEVNGKPAVLKLTATPGEAAQLARMGEVKLADNVRVPEVKGWGDAAKLDPARIDPSGRMDHDVFGAAADMHSNVLVMERLEGFSRAEDVISGRKALEHPISERDWKGLTDSLDAMHKAGVVHGDINTGNIMIRQTGGRTEFAIIDPLWSRRDAPAEVKASDRASLSGKDGIAGKLADAGVLDRSMVDTHLAPAAEAPRVELAPRKSKGLDPNLTTTGERQVDNWHDWFDREHAEDKGKITQAHADGSVDWKPADKVNEAARDRTRRALEQLAPDVPQPADKSLIRLPKPEVLKDAIRQRSGFEIEFPPKGGKAEISPDHYIEIAANGRYPVRDVHDLYEHLPAFDKVHSGEVKAIGEFGHDLKNSPLSPELQTKVAERLGGRLDTDIYHREATAAKMEPGKLYEKAAGDVEAVLKEKGATPDVHKQVADWAAARGDAFGDAVAAKLRGEPDASSSAVKPRKSKTTVDEPIAEAAKEEKGPSTPRSREMPSQREPGSTPPDATWRQGLQTSGREAPRAAAPPPAEPARKAVAPSASDADLAAHVKGTNGDAAFIRTTAYDKPGRANQDHVHIDADRKLMIVADGMGGHAGGEVASGIAKRVIAEEVTSRIGPDTTPQEAGQILRDALTKANKAIFDEAQANPEQKGMGTTASVAVVVRDPILGRDVLVTANVGDSAVMVRRAGGELEHASYEDPSVTHFDKQNFYGELRDFGVDVDKVEKTGKLPARELERLMGEQDSIDMLEHHANQVGKHGRQMLKEAFENDTDLDIRSMFETHKARNVVGNALGVGPDLALTRESVQHVEVHKGDVAVAVTDGVLDNLGHDRMNAISRGTDSPAELMNRLAGESKRIAKSPADAHEARYAKPDDISGVALRIGGEPPSAGGGGDNGPATKRSEGVKLKERPSKSGDLGADPESLFESSNRGPKNGIKEPGTFKSIEKGPDGVPRLRDIRADDFSFSYQFDTPNHGRASSVYTDEVATHEKLKPGEPFLMGSKDFNSCAGFAVRAVHPDGTESVIFGHLTADNPNGQFASVKGVLGQLRGVQHVELFMTMDPAAASAGAADLARSYHDFAGQFPMEVRQSGTGPHGERLYEPVDTRAMHSELLQALGPEFRGKLDMKVDLARIGADGKPIPRDMFISNEGITINHGNQSPERLDWPSHTETPPSLVQRAKAELASILPESLSRRLGIEAPAVEAPAVELKARQSKGPTGEIEPPSSAEVERWRQRNADFKAGKAGIFEPRDMEVSKFMHENPGYKPAPSAAEFQRFQDLNRLMKEGRSPAMLSRDMEVAQFMHENPGFRPAPEAVRPPSNPPPSAPVQRPLEISGREAPRPTTPPAEKPGPNGEPTRAEVEHYQYLENLRRQGQSPAMMGRDWEVSSYMAAHPDYQPGRVEMRTPAQGLPATAPSGEFLKGRASEPIQSNHVTIEAGGKRLEVLTPDQYYGRYPKDAVRLGPTVERVIVDPANPSAIKGLRAGEEFTLGRGAPVDGKPGVFMDQAGRFELPSSVSGQHLKITNTAEGLRVTDLGSTNGTRIETPHRAAALAPEIEVPTSRAPPAVEALDMRSGHVENFSTDHPVDIDVAGRKFRVMDVDQFNAAHPEAAIADGQGVKKVLFDPENPRSLKALREGESFEFGRGNPKANERFGLDSKVSGKQFNITETPEGVRIEQVGKSNPTRVEGVRAENSPHDLSEAKTQPDIRLPEKAQAHGGVDPAATDADLAKHVASTDGDAAFVRTTAKKEAGRPNEDHVHIDAGKKLLIVADGMGGHGHGDIASGIAKRVIAEEVASRIGPNTTPAEAGQILRDALTKANKAILDDVKANPSHKGMGTTASVGVVVVDPVTGRNVLVTANVGDSAVMVRRSDGALDHVSHEDSSYVSAFQDHLYKQLGEGGIDVAKLEKTGKLSPAEVKKIMADPKLRQALEGSMAMSKGGPEMLQAAVQHGTPLDVRSAFETHGQRNVIGNALGVKPDLMITPETVRTTEVRKGDVALAVSDGVLDNLGHDRMNAISKDAKTPAELMDKLAAESERIATNPADAHEARYRKPDDISGVALRIGEPPAGAGQGEGLKPRRSKSSGPEGPVEPPSFVDRAKAELASLLPESLSRRLGLEPRQSKGLTGEIEPPSYAEIERWRQSNANAKAGNAGIWTPRDIEVGRFMNDNPGYKAPPSAAEFGRYHDINRRMQEGGSPRMLPRDFEVMKYMTDHPNYQPKAEPAPVAPAPSAPRPIEPVRQAEPRPAATAVEKPGPNGEPTRAEFEHYQYLESLRRQGQQPAMLGRDWEVSSYMAKHPDYRPGAPERVAPAGSRSPAVESPTGPPSAAEVERWQQKNADARAGKAGIWSPRDIEVGRFMNDNPGYKGAPALERPGTVAMGSGRVETFSTEHPVEIDVAGRKFRVMDVDKFNAAHPEAAIADGQGVKKVLFDPENPRSMKALREGESFEFGRGNAKASERFGLDGNISRKQFTITETPEGVRIEQVGTSHPTRVEGVRVEGGPEKVTGLDLKPRRSKGAVEVPPAELTPPPAVDHYMSPEAFSNAHPKPKNAAGEEIGVYHDEQHSRNVQKMAFEFATARGLSPADAKFVSEVALLHDFDPSRGAGSPARVLKTIEALEADFRGEMSLDGRPGRSTLQEKFGWDQSKLDMAKAMIQRTEFPFGDVHPNPAYKDASPLARYEKMLGDMPAGDRRFALREGALLSEYADKASWYMTEDFHGALNTVEGLAHEINTATGGKANMDAGKLDTADFLSKVGSPESFAHDEALAKKFGIDDFRLPNREEAFAKLPPEYKRTFDSNLEGFKTFKETLTKGGDLAAAREAGAATAQQALGAGAEPKVELKSRQLKSGGEEPAEESAPKKPTLTERAKGALASMLPESWARRLGLVEPAPAPTPEPASYQGAGRVRSDVKASGAAPRLYDSIVDAANQSAVGEGDASLTMKRHVNTEQKSIVFDYISKEGAALKDFKVYGSEAELLSWRYPEYSVRSAVIGPRAMDGITRFYSDVSVEGVRDIKELVKQTKAQGIEDGFAGGKFELYADFKVPGRPAEALRVQDSLASMDIETLRTKFGEKLGPEGLKEAAANPSGRLELLLDHGIGPKELSAKTEPGVSEAPPKLELKARASKPEEFEPTERFGASTTGVGSRTSVEFKGETLHLGRLVGEGTFGEVYEIPGKPDQVAKVAKDGVSVEAQKAWAREELAGYKALEGTDIPHAKLLDSDPAGRVLIKERIRGETLDQLMDKGPLSKEHKAAYADFTAKLLEHGLMTDANAGNLIWDGKKFVLVDAGGVHPAEPGAISSMAMDGLRGKGMTPHELLGSLRDRLGADHPDLGAIEHGISQSPALQKAQGQLDLAPRKSKGTIETPQGVEVQQITTRGPELKLSEEHFSPSDIDFAKSSQHLTIHHGGEVAGGQFNSERFANPSDVVELVTRSLPDKIHYDQFGRAEITLKIASPDGKPLGYSGVLSAAELAARIPGAKIETAARTPGGVPGELNGMKGTWYPEMVKDASGKFVVDRDAEGAVKNPKFKFEPDARIATVPAEALKRGLETDKVTVVIQKDAAGKPTVVTMFPGENAPAFPAHIEKYGVKTTHAESAESKFWSDHVFLKAEPVESAAAAAPSGAEPKVELKSRQSKGGPEDASEGPKTAQKHIDSLEDEYRAHQAEGIMYRAAMRMAEAGGVDVLAHADETTLNFAAEREFIASKGEKGKLNDLLKYAYTKRANELRAADAKGEPEAAPGPDGRSEKVLELKARLIEDHMRHVIETDPVARKELGHLLEIPDPELGKVRFRFEKEPGELPGKSNAAYISATHEVVFSRELADVPHELLVATGAHEVQHSYDRAARTRTVEVAAGEQVSGRAAEAGKLKMAKLADLGADIQNLTERQNSYREWIREADPGPTRDALIRRYLENDAELGELKHQADLSLKVQNEPPKVSERAQELWDEVIRKYDPQSQLQVYHGDFHGAEVAQNVQRAIDAARESGEALSPRQELLLRTASRWHDIQPRAEGTAPSVERTIEWMRTAPEAQAFLHETGLTHDEVASLIRSTDFHPDPLQRAKLQQKFLDSALEAFPEGQKGWAVRWGERMAVMDQASTYFHDPAVAHERVVGLANELRAAGAPVTDEGMLRGTAKFMSELENTQGFRDAKSRGLISRDQLAAFEANKQYFAELASPPPSEPPRSGTFMKAVHAVEDALRPGERPAQPAPEEAVASIELKPRASKRDDTMARNADVMSQVEDHLFTGAPDTYSLALKRSRAPAAELHGVSDHEMLGGVLFEGKVKGKDAAIRQFADPYDTASPEAWQEKIDHFRGQLDLAKRMGTVVPDMAPAVIGEVNTGGNPAYATERVRGKDLQSLTPREAMKLVTPETARKVADGMRRLNAAGLGGELGPSVVILTEPQTINGVAHKAGDPIFMDPRDLGADRAKWESPKAFAEDVASVRVYSEDLVATHPDVPFRDAFDQHPDFAFVREGVNELAAAQKAQAPAPSGEHAGKVEAARSYLEDLIKGDPALSKKLGHLLDVPAGEMGQVKIRVSEPGEMKGSLVNKNAHFDPATNEIVFNRKFVDAPASEWAPTVGHELQHAYDHNVRGALTHENTLPSEYRAHEVTALLYDAAAQRRAAAGDSTPLTPLGEHQRVVSRRYAEGNLDKYVNSAYSYDGKLVATPRAILKETIPRLNEANVELQKRIDLTPEGPERDALVGQYMANEMKLAHYRLQFDRSLQVPDAPADSNLKSRKSKSDFGGRDEDGLHRNIGDPNGGGPYRSLPAAPEPRALQRVPPPGPLDMMKPISGELGIRGIQREVRGGIDASGEAAIYRASTKDGELSVKTVAKEGRSLMVEAEAMRDLQQRFSDPHEGSDAPIPDNFHLPKFVDYGRMNKDFVAGEGEQPTVKRGLLERMRLRSDNGVEALVTEAPPHGQTLESYVRQGGKISSAEWEGLMRGFERMKRLGWSQREISPAQIVVHEDVGGHLQFTLTDLSGIRPTEVDRYFNGASWRMEEKIVQTGAIVDEPGVRPRIRSTEPVVLTESLADQETRLVGEARKIKSRSYEQQQFLERLSAGQRVEGEYYVAVKPEEYARLKLGEGLSDKLFLKGRANADGWLNEWRRPQPEANNGDIVLRVTGRAVMAKESGFKWENPLVYRVEGVEPVGRLRGRELDPVDADGQLLPAKKEPLQLKARASKSSPDIDKVNSELLLQADVERGGSGEPPALPPADLARRGGPKAELLSVLSHEGSAGPVFNAKVHGVEAAVKVYEAPKDLDPGSARKFWQDKTVLLNHEVEVGRRVSEIVPDMAPPILGEVNVDGRPAFAMGKIRGIDLYDLTPRQAREMLTLETAAKVEDGIRRLAEAGLGGKDSPQVMILTEDQVINGVAHKKGDPIFMDFGGMHGEARRWDSPKTFAALVESRRLIGLETEASHPDTPISRIVLKPEEFKRLNDQAKANVEAAKQAAPSPEAETGPAAKPTLGQRAKQALASLMPDSWAARLGLRPAADAASSKQASPEGTDKSTDKPELKPRASRGAGRGEEVQLRADLAPAIREFVAKNPEYRPEQVQSAIERFELDAGISISVAGGPRYLFEKSPSFMKDYLEPMREPAQKAQAPAGIKLSDDQVRDIRAKDFKALEAERGAMTPEEWKELRPKMQEAREYKYKLLEAGALEPGRDYHGTSMKALSKIVRERAMQVGENNIDGEAIYAERLSERDIRNGNTLAVDGYAYKQSLRDESEPVLLRFKGLKSRADSPGFAAKMDTGERSYIPADRIEAFDPVSQKWVPAKELASRLGETVQEPEQSLGLKARASKRKDQTSSSEEQPHSFAEGTKHFIAGFLPSKLAEKWGLLETPKQSPGGSQPAPQPENGAAGPNAAAADIGSSNADAAELDRTPSRRELKLRQYAGKSQEPAGDAPKPSVPPPSSNPPASQPIQVVSRIGDDSGLSRMAEEAGKDRTVQRDLNSLVNKFVAGNANPGLGSKALFGDVRYLRSDSGARVFYRITDNRVEILAKASKANQDRVIQRLQRLYGQ
jgi:serine/threonine protein phosphatase PrpC/tRNA A-37 threonylcarbamoyl transferase component Bud32